MWTEKYRPKTPLELDCPDHIRSFLEHAQTNGFPHLLLYGPPGTGKTTFASMLRPTVELNASDDRGIDVVRNKIKKLANTVAPQVILLDECENLTRDAQTCLRRVLEDFPNTKFIFCTNYYSRIIDPLKSRLLKIKFGPRKGDVLKTVGEKEGMGLSEAFYEELIRKCNGDMRRCINVLQAVKPLGEFDLDDVLGRVKDEKVEEFLAGARGEFVEKFLFEGHSVLQLILQLNERLDEVKDERRMGEFAQTLAECEQKCLIGCSEEVVLRYLCESWAKG